MLTAKRQLELQLDKLLKIGLKAEVTADIAIAFEKAIDKLQQQFDEVREE